MDLRLGERTAETVAVYFERADTPEIRRFLPQKARTLDEALDDFRRTQRPGADSFGQTIWVDGRYVGDVWAYCIDPGGEPQAMVSYCIFDPACRNRGAATEALELFLAEIFSRYGAEAVGAFTYSENRASIRVLEKNGFRLRETFMEDGRESRYYQLEG